MSIPEYEEVTTWQLINLLLNEQDKTGYKELGTWVTKPAPKMPLTRYGWL